MVLVAAHGLALVLVTGQVLGPAALTLTPASLVLEVLDPGQVLVQEAPFQVHPTPIRYQEARNLDLVAGQVLVQAAHKLVLEAGQVQVAPSQVHPTLTRDQSVQNLILAVAHGRALVQVTGQVLGQAARNLVLAVAHGRALVTGQVLGREALTTAPLVLEVLALGQVLGQEVLSQVHPTPTQVRTPELDRRTLAVGLIRTQGNQR